MSNGDDKNKVLPSASSVQAVAGLVAVAIGVLAVTSLAIATMAFIDSGRDATHVVPLATSAFGVVSAVVGAYLGVKIGTEQSKAFADEATKAHAQLGAVQALLPEDVRPQAMQAAAEARNITAETKAPGGA